jgi:hypothetical protein
MVNFVLTANVLHQNIKVNHMQLYNQTIIESGLETLLSYYNFDKETYICVVQLINQGLNVGAVIDAAKGFTDPMLDKPGSDYSNDHMTAYSKLNSLVAA